MTPFYGNLLRSCADLFARRLAERLGGLPLALATAGACLSRNVMMTFERYLEEYNQQWKVSRRRHPNLDEYHQDITLYTTWRISYDRLLTECSDGKSHAAVLLKLLAYFDHQCVRYSDLSAGLRISCPEQWMQTVFSEDVELGEEMNVLMGYCFVDFDYTAQRWSMHACVHDWTLAVLNERINPSLFWYAFDCIAAPVRGHTGELELTAYTHLASHAKQLVKTLILRQPYEYVFATSDRQEDHHHPEESCADRFQATEPNRDRFLEVDLIQATVRDLGDAENIIMLLAKQGHYASSTQLTVRVLASTERTLGSCHLSSLRFALMLAQSYHDQRILDKAEHLYMRVWSESEHSLGSTHRITLQTMQRIGKLYLNQDKPDQAEKMMLRIYNAYQETQGADHLETIEIVDNLATVYQVQRKLERSEQMFLRALDARQQQLGQHHRMTLATMGNLAIVYRDQGQLVKAELLLKQTVAGQEKTLGPNRIETLDTLYNLGHLYHKMGKLDVAHSTLLRVVNGRTETLGPDDYETLYALYELGGVCKNRREFGKAADLLTQALDGRKRTLGSSHVETLETMHALAVVYLDQENFEKAEEMLLKTLDQQKEILGQQDTRTLRTLHVLGEVYNQPPVENAARAEPYYLESLNGYTATLGSDHPTTLRVARDLGRFYHNTNRTNEAVRLYLRTLDGCHQTMGPDHEDTYRTSQLLTKLYWENNMVSDMVVLCLKWGTKQLVLFGKLGRMLLRCWDDVSAQQAFQHQQILSHGCRAPVLCDSCNRVITTATGRAVCRDCPDTDFCRRCFTKYKERLSTIPAGRGHSFVEILLEAPEAEVDFEPVEEGISMNEVLATSWLEHLAITTGARIGELEV